MHEELEFIRMLGADLIIACGEPEKPEVKKSIDEVGRPAAHSLKSCDRLCWFGLNSLLNRGAILCFADEQCLGKPKQNLEGEARET